MKHGKKSAWKNKLQALLFVIGCTLLLFWVLALATDNIETEKLDRDTMIGTPSKLYKTALLRTNKGDIEIEFIPSKAPHTVNNFINLSESGFYDGIQFHRVVKGFIVQGGDPLTKESDASMYGRGGPGYVFDDEINDEPLARGVVAMANSGRNTNGSQFFILVAQAAPWLETKHTVFAKVIGGMNVVDLISNIKTKGELPVEPVVIQSVVLR